MGEDWQTWSAAMYLYAAACVEQRKTPFFEAVRNLIEAYFYSQTMVFIGKFSK
jgi:hypothetical protein